MSSAAASTPRYAAKKAAILDAAARELNARGVKGMTLAGVAARVGLITTSVTYYYRRKEDLAAATLLRAVESFDAMVTEAGEAADARARLHRFLDLYLERSRRVRLGEATPLVYFNEILALKEPQRGIAAAAFAQMFRRVRGLFDAPEFEDLDRVERNARTHLLLEQAFWTKGWLGRYDLEDYDRIRDRMFDILVNGLAAPGQAWAPGAPPVRTSAEPAREDFLRAATRLMNQRGYLGASVEDISAELNVTKGSFYHHIDAKDDMVLACVRRSLETLRTMQMAVRARPGNSFDRLSTAISALVELQLSDYGPLLRSSVISALPTEMGRELADQYARLTLRSAGLVADGIAEGDIRAVDPIIASQMIAATLSGGATLATWAPGVTRERAAHAFVRPLMMGVFAR